MNNRNIILIFNEGTMNGVFGAGVATALQEANIYSQIHSIYGISAGAHNAAYFLTKDTHNGSSIYYEDLSEKKFIHKYIFWFFLKQLSLNIFIPQKIKPFLDIDYLIYIERTTKKLKTELLKKSKINFFIKVFNVKSGKVEYLDGNNNTLEKIKASSALIPFYPNTVKIGVSQYSDGDTLSNKFDDYLIKEIENNKDKTYIFISNQPINLSAQLKTLLSNFFWSILLALYLKNISVFFKKNNPLEYYKFKKILNKPNVLYIASDINIHNLCDDKNTMLNLYKHGIAKTKKFLLTNKLQI